MEMHYAPEPVPCSEWNHHVVQTYTNISQKSKIQKHFHSHTFWRWDTRSVTKLLSSLFSHLNKKDHRNFSAEANAQAVRYIVT